MATKTVSGQRTSTARQASSSRSTQITATQHDEVARVAYQLWIDGGCQNGRDREDWAKAEAIVRSRLS